MLVPRIGCGMISHPKVFPLLYDMGFFKKRVNGAFDGGNAYAVPLVLQIFKNDNNSFHQVI